MVIGGLQKLSMVDYPGKMACTIFFTGCNFRCPYCHNSILVLPEPGQEMIEEEELFRFLKKRQGILEAVCVSGGEPLLQGKKMIPFLEKIKELGYQVKLDTNGSFPELLKELCERGLVDYVAMDIKNSMDHYGKTIGKEQEAIQSLLANVQESARYLMDGNVDYEFRTTLVKGIHEPEDIEKICHWIGGAKIWYLQNFKDSGSLLGADSCSMEPFSENEIQNMKKTAELNKINLFVRNV